MKCIIIQGREHLFPWCHKLFTALLGGGNYPWPLGLIIMLFLLPFFLYAIHFTYCLTLSCSPTCANPMCIMFFSLTHWKTTQARETMYMILRLEITLVIECDPGAFFECLSMYHISLLVSPASSRPQSILMRADGVSAMCLSKQKAQSVLSRWIFVVCVVYQMIVTRWAYITIQKIFFVILFINSFIYSFIHSFTTLLIHCRSQGSWNQS